MIDRDRSLLKRGIEFMLSSVKRWAVTKKDAGIVTIIVLFRFFLEFVYIYFVHAHYAYYHFGLDYNLTYWLISYIFLFCVIWKVPGLLRTASLADIVLALLILMYFVPYTVLFAYSRHDLGYALFVLGYFLLMILFNQYIKINHVVIKGIHKGIGDTKYFVIIIVVMGLIRVAASGIYTGFRISFDFSEYYELRAEAREYALPEVIRYLLGWSTTGLTVGLVYSIIRKRKLLSVFIAICTVLAFSFNGKKSILFSLIIAVLIGLFYDEKYIRKIPAAFTALTGAGLLESLVLGERSFICKYFLRRILFIPPNISILHYDYFSTHEYDYLRTSVMRRFGFQSPYASYGKIPRLIGSVYFGKRAMAFNANTGLCGDAFANFGYLSILFAPFVIILTFKLIEKCARFSDREVQVMVSIYVAYAFINGSYFTLLFTNGMLFLMILLLFLNNRKSEQPDLVNDYRYSIDPRRGK